MSLLLWLAQCLLWLLLFDEICLDKQELYTPNNEGKIAEYSGKIWLRFGASWLEILAQPFWEH